MEKLTPVEIGKRLKKAREDRRLDVPSIASQTGLNKTTIYRYENGEVKNIKKPIIESLANILDVNPLWLIGESDQKENQNTHQNSETKIISKNVTYLRKKNKLSQEAVSSQLNIPLNRYIQIENSIVDMNMVELKAFMDFYEIPDIGSMFLDLENKEAHLSKILSEYQPLFDYQPSPEPLNILTSVPSETQKTSAAINSDIRKITVYGKVCAGNGIEAFEDPIDEIGDPYYRIKGEKFALLVDGDSMNNVVNHGMYAIIEKKETVNNGEIAVVLIDNEVGMLKRFYQLDESTVVLKPDSTNLTHKSMMFENEEINRLKILGRYIGHVSPMLNLT